LILMARLFSIIAAISEDSCSFVAEILIS
jgi:hypothetical protein